MWQFHPPVQLIQPIRHGMTEFSQFIGWENCALGGNEVSTLARTKTYLRSDIMCARCVFVCARACVVTSAIAIRQFQLTSHCSVDAVVSCHVKSTLFCILHAAFVFIYVEMWRHFRFSFAIQKFSRFSSVFEKEKNGKQFKPIQMAWHFHDNWKSTQNSFNLIWKGNKKCASICKIVQNWNLMNLVVQKEYRNDERLWANYGCAHK